MNVATLQPVSARTPTVDTPRTQIDAEGGPFLIADWTDALWVHFEVAADTLRNAVPAPFEPDTRGGHAYVSLFGFTMRRLRLCIAGHSIGGGATLAPPRVYLGLYACVRHGDEAGALLLVQWGGEMTARFGVPVQPGTLMMETEPASAAIHTTVHGNDRSLDFRAARLPRAGFEPAAADTLDDFLTARRTLFTKERDIVRACRTAHEPWPLAAVDVGVRDLTLLQHLFPWFAGATPVTAGFSPGVRDAWVGRPRCVNGPACQRPWPVSAKD